LVFHGFEFHMHLTKMAQHAYLFFYGTHEFADFSELNKRTMACVATIYLFFWVWSDAYMCNDDCHFFDLSPPFLPMLSI
jgi:hypothetical protein